MLELRKQIGLALAATGRFGEADRHLSILRADLIGARRPADEDVIEIDAILAKLRLPL